MRCLTPRDCGVKADETEVAAVLVRFRDGAPPVTGEAQIMDGGLHLGRVRRFGGGT